MKRLLATLLLLPLSDFARAGNDGPNANPPSGPILTDNVAAQFTMTCQGDCPNGVYAGVRIFQSGEVQTFLKYRADSREKFQFVDRLSPPQMIAFNREYAALTFSRLEPLPLKPGCVPSTDTTSIVTVRKNGQQADIAANRGCRQWEMRSSEKTQIGMPIISLLIAYASRI